MPRIKPLVLNDTQKILIKTLSRVSFATLDQLQYWASIKKSTVSESIKHLSRHGLVKIMNEVKPYIIQITHAGARVSGVKLPSGKTFFSWAVKTHRVYRNDAEILLRESKAGFAMQNRYYHYSLGLNPTQSEHSAIDAEDHHYFCLIDDYRMHARRMSHSWTRRHTPNRDYYNDTKGFRWQDMCHSMLVFSTDADQLQSFKSTNLELDMPVNFFYLKPRWH